SILGQRAPEAVLLLEKLVGVLIPNPSEIAAAGGSSVVISGILEDSTLSAFIGQTATEQADYMEDWKNNKTFTIEQRRNTTSRTPVTQQTHNQETNQLIHPLELDQEETMSQRNNANGDTKPYYTSIMHLNTTSHKTDQEGKEYKIILTQMKNTNLMMNTREATKQLKQEDLNTRIRLMFEEREVQRRLDSVYDDTCQLLQKASSITPHSKSLEKVVPNSTLVQLAVKYMMKSQNSITTSKLPS
ncbi:hypothetical protein OSTOST_14828, partial [Ostertagia ostertagi]